MEDGNLFEKKPAFDEYVFIKNVGKRAIKIVLRKFEEIHFKDIKFNKPGNMSYLIEYQSEDIRNKVVWGDYQNPPPEKVKELFEYLNGFNQL